MMSSRSRMPIIIQDQTLTLLAARYRVLRSRLRLISQSTDEHNMMCLYMEVVFAGVLAAVATFNAPFVLRGGGSQNLVGLLSSLPALVAMFLFLPSARIWEKQRGYARLIPFSLGAARIGYLVIALLPFFKGMDVPAVTVAVLVAMAAPSVFFSTGWSPMLSDVVPARSRATVLAWRAILSSGTIAIFTYLIGLLLDHGVFPTNYQWMYFIGLLGGGLSVFFVARMRMPAPPEGAATPQAEEATAAGGESDADAGQPAHLAPPRGRRVPWRAALRGAVQEHPAFARIIVNTFVFDFGASLVGPLYVILFVRGLAASDSWVGLNATLANIGVVVGYWLWRKVVRRLGEAAHATVGITSDHHICFHGGSGAESDVDLAIRLLDQPVQSRRGLEPRRDFSGPVARRSQVRRDGDL